jgi:DNA/RNA endonuclease YhcR with UshA esterase domain
LKELKSLAPDQQPEASSAVTGDGKIKLDLPVAGAAVAVNEAAIQDQLFRIYLTIAVQFGKVEASAESKSAFEKAKALAKVEPVAAAKAEKLLILAQFLAGELAK